MLNFFQHTCYLHASIPRLISKEGVVQTLPSVPWARARSKFTLLAETFLMLLNEVKTYFFQYFIIEFKIHKSLTVNNLTIFNAKKHGLT